MSLKKSDEVDYRIEGDDMQAVVVTLDPAEVVIAEAGAMLYMTDGVSMQTSMSTDKNKGFFGNLMKAAGRMLTGESFFITNFENTGGQRADVAFAAPYPGKIIPLDLSTYQGGFIAQKDSFLCAARGTDVSIHFNRKIGSGLFGGEGFILEKLSGDGLAFIHAGGTVIERRLEPGQTLRVDTGCIVGFESTVDFDIQFVGGFKNALFGGEGLWFATVKGPGRVFLQTLPFARLANRIATVVGTGRSTEQTAGGLLGGLMGDHD
ncbi:MAG: TIGR00266 family protein [Silvanigrellaceae bacterium]